MITSTSDYNQASFGQAGLSIIGAGDSASGEFCTVQAFEESVVTLTSIVGDSLTGVTLTVGTVVTGRFSDVSVTSGAVAAYQSPTYTPPQVSGPVFDPDYQAVLDYMTANAIMLPTASTQAAQNDFMIAMKASGAWTKLDFLIVPATDGDSSTALVDWKRLLLATAVNSPTFTTLEGFTGNGTTAFVNFNYNPSAGTNFQLNAASLFWYKRTVGTVGAGGIIGQVSGTTNIEISNRGTNYHLLNTNFGTLGSTPSVNFSTIGLAAQIKTASLAGIRYLNKTGTAYTHDGANARTSPNLAAFIALTNYSNVQLSIIGGGGNINAEWDDFADAINNYMIAIGKNV